MQKQVAIYELVWKELGISTYFNYLCDLFILFACKRVSNDLILAKVWMFSNGCESCEKV